MGINIGTMGPNIKALTDWQSFWERGLAYRKTARGMCGHRDKFNTAIVYNVLSMAVEGLFMGYFMAHGGLPENHTLRDLVDYSHHYLELPLDVATGLVRMDGIQQICSVDSFSIKDLNWDEVEQFLVWTDTLETVLAKGIVL